jgi:hypothetical protein
MAPYALVTTSDVDGTVVVDNRGAQTAFILFSKFLDLRPVSAAND